MIYLRRRNPCIRMVQVVNQQTSATVTIAAAQAGSILLFAHRWSSATPPVVPSGFTQIDTHAFASSSVTWSWGVAAGGETSITGETGGSANRTIAIEYAGARVSQGVNAGTKNSGGAGSGPVLTYPTLTLKDPVRSWCVGMSVTDVGRNRTATTVTQRTSWSTGSIVDFVDSGAPVQTWASQTITSASVTSYATQSIELVSL